MGKIAKVQARIRADVEEKKEARRKVAERKAKKKTPARVNAHLSGTKIQEAQKQIEKQVKGEKAGDDLQAKFIRDLDTLHGLSLADKATRKAELIEKYREYCESFIKEGYDRQDTIFQHWVVWLFDAGLQERKYLDEFLEKIKDVIRLKQKPTFMKRTYQEFLHWSMLKWAEEEYSEKRSPDPWFSKICEEVKAWEKIQHQLSRRMLTLWFKLLQDSGDFKQAAKIGKIAMEYKAKIKGRYNELIAGLEK